MNIFFVDSDPEIAASMLCLQHRAKMLTESVQILCTVAHGINSEDAVDLKLWKPTHANHPCVHWVRDYGTARWWLLKHGYKLAALHDKKRPEAAIDQLYRIDEFFGRNVKSCGILLPDPPQCMPVEFQHPNNTVRAYHKYYADKASLWATYGKPHLRMRYREPSCVPLWLEAILGNNWQRFIHFTDDVN